jgi:UDP-N-acetylglucosamine 2-epimerase (non-hydrolysing)
MTIGNRLKIVCVVGARPNFMKIAPLLRALATHRNVESTLVHTGQHYDESLSEVFFQDLGIRRPDVSLEVGSGTHAAQTAEVMERFEAFLREKTASGGRCDEVVVVGDVNSTMAAALAAVKLGVPVAHVEAGLRSFDRSMPEEINRIVTDAVSEALFVSEPAGMDNLRREGHGEEQLHLVGNVMIDTLLTLLPRAKQRPALRDYGLTPGRYGVVTLHRPANVDDPDVLGRLVDVLVEASADIPLVFPVHPRTRNRLDAFGLAPRLAAAAEIRLAPSLGYLDCLALTSRAKVIITDSGGLQEESTALEIPCLTARRNTERPVTVDTGTSTLVGNDPDKLKACLRSVLEGTYKRGVCPALWDGHAAQRIAKILAERN